MHETWSWHAYRYALGFLRKIGCDSGGGINSPSHQTSRWLTSTENSTVGWSDAIFFRASVHPVPLPRHVAVEVLRHNCSDAMHRRSVGSSGAEDPASKSPLLASNRPSDRPTLHLDQGVGSSGAEGFVLARLCLDSNWASDRPTVSPLSPSNHPVLLSSLLFLCNSSDATRKWTVGSSDSTQGFTLYTKSSDDCTDACIWGTVGSSDGVFSFPFLARFWPLFFSFLHVVFLHPWDLEMSTKTC
jgi:hypothetical protein